MQVWTKTILRTLKSSHKTIQTDFLLTQSLGKKKHQPRKQSISSLRQDYTPCFRRFDPWSRPVECRGRSRSWETRPFRALSFERDPLCQSRGSGRAVPDSAARPETDRFVVATSAALVLTSFWGSCCIYFFSKVLLSVPDVCMGSNMPVSSEKQSDVSALWFHLGNLWI